MPHKSKRKSYRSTKAHPKPAYKKAKRGKAKKKGY
jgi:hypothetical protein